MASNRVRGITLEINGDTTGLTKALQGVNGKIRDTQTTLKDVDKLLKLDPTNTELLSQKQKLLAQAVESTQDKLKTLKTASEEAAKSAGNYEAWREKYEPLQKEIDETSDKLRELRQKAADAKEQFEGGKISEDQYKAIQGELAETSAKLKDLKEQKQALDDEFGHPISPEQYDALQREIIETEQDLQKLEDAANDTGEELDELDDAADDVNVSFGSMVKNKVVDMLGDALLDIGRKAVDAAKYCVEVGSSFGSAMSKVKATSGASSQSMTRLADKAKEMGAKTKFSATEAGEAMNYMAMAGWKTEDMLSGIDGVMNLAAASGEDLATTSDIVTDALTAFGKSSEESGRLADIMAAASANANTNVGMMGETFKYAAPVAGALGYSMEDTALAIGLMANSGIKASQAGTSIRSGLTRLAAPTKQVREAMDKYGISLTDASGNMLSFRELMLQMREKLGGLSEAEQTAAVSALAGKNAMSGWLAIINGSDSDFDKLSGAIDNSNGAAERMAETMQDNLSGKLTILNSALEGLGIAVYEYVSGPLQSVVEFVTGIISGITETISPQRTELETFIDDVSQANDEVERSLEHARQTVETGDAKAAEIEAYQGMLNGILDSCEEFNLVTLDNGEQAIVNSSGEVVQSFEEIDTSANTTEEILEKWASGGFNTEGIAGSSEKAQDLIGFVTDSVDTVESRLDNFAASGISTEGVDAGKEAIIQVFSEIGTEINAYTDKIDAAGNVELDTASIGEGTSLAVTFFNEASGSVETFTTDLKDLNGSNLNLSHVAEEFTQVEDSVKRTYTITDEFTKQKITNMVDTLGGSVEGLAEAWDRQTGKLTASKRELEEWFDTAKEVAKYEALQEAMDELNIAWGEAYVNQFKADSALKAAQEELSAYMEEYGASSEYAIMNADEWASKQVELEGNVKAATKEQERANEALTEAQNALDTTGKALDEFAEKEGFTADKNKEVTTTGEDAANAVGEVGDESEEAADQVDKLTQKQQEAIDTLKSWDENITDDFLADLRSQMQLSESDFADWAQNLITRNEEIKDSYDKLTTGIKETLNQFSLDVTGEGNWLDNIEKNLEEENAKMGAWVENMLYLRDRLMEDGSFQHVYDYLVEAGPEKGADAAAAFADGFRNGNQAQISEIESQIATQLDLSQSAELIASASTTGQQYAAVISSESVEGLQEAAESKIAEAARNTGEATSQNVAEGVKNGSPLIEEALDNSVTDATDSAKTEAENAKDSGETMGDATTEGIESTKAEVKQATEGMISDAREAADMIVSEFHRTGQLIPQKVKQGIEEANNMGVGPVSAVEDMMNDAVEAVRAAVPDMEAAAQELVNALTTATSGFTWTLPRPQIPHINWSWNRISYGDGGWFDIPEFSVDWFAKAMKDGMILNDPTIFGAMNGKLLGAGEAGSEVVVGTHSLMDMIQQAVSRQQTANVNNFGGVTVNVYGHEGQDIRQLADEIEYRIALNVKKKEAGFA